MFHEKHLISLMRLHHEYVVLYSLFILGIIQLCRLGSMKDLGYRNEKSYEPAISENITLSYT